MNLMHAKSVIDDSSMDISTSSSAIDVATIDETIIDEVPISVAANNEFALECFARAESTINEITIVDIAVDVSANDEFASVALVESTINESTTDEFKVDDVSANDEFASVALVESTINESTTDEFKVDDVSANDDLDNPDNETNVAPFPDVIDELIQNYNDREKAFERLFQEKVFWQK